MIIRSQDKKIVLNFANITDLNINTTKKDESEIIACFPYSIIDDCGYNKIGTYSTEKKAIKVLDMIQKAYSKANYYFISNGFVQNVVFEMPQDSEV